jgi:hypothetical protein
MHYTLAKLDAEANRQLPTLHSLVEQTVYVAPSKLLNSLVGNGPAFSSVNPGGSIAQQHQGSRWVRGTPGVLC